MKWRPSAVLNRIALKSPKSLMPSASFIRVNLDHNSVILCMAYKTNSNRRFRASLGMRVRLCGAGFSSSHFLAVVLFLCLCSFAVAVGTTSVRCSLENYVGMNGVGWVCMLGRHVGNISLWPPRGLVSYL